MAKVIHTILSLTDNMSKGLLDAAKRTETVDKKMESATKTVVNFGRKAHRAVEDFAKKSAAAFAGAAAAFGGYSVKIGMDFESQMSKVAAISGAGASEIEGLTEAAREMGRNSVFSATESAKALEYMAMAGWSTAQMMEGLPGVINLAAASGEDLAAVSDILTDSLTGFGLQAKDSAHFADVLAKASSSSNTNVSLMGETFKYLAPVAGSLGYSVEDTAVAVGLLANAGIKGSEAGTALRGTLTHLVKPSASAAGYMNALGLSLTDTAGNVKPLSALITDLRSSFAGLTDAQKSEYAAGIAGQEAMSGLLAIVNASDADFAKLTNAIADSDGTAADMAATMNDNLKGSLNFLKSAVEDVGITFYDSIKDKASGAIDSVTAKLTELNQNGTIDAFAQKVGSGIGFVIDNGSKLVSWAIENKDLLIGAAKAVAAGVGVVKFTQFANSTVNTIKTLNLFRKTLVQVGKANLPALASGFSGAASKLLGFGKAAVSFLVSNPVVLAIAAIVAAGVLLYKNWDTVKAAAINLYEKAKGVFSGVKDAIVGAFNSAKETVAGFFSWLDAKIESVPILGSIYKGGKEVVGGAVDFIGGLVGKNAMGTNYWHGGLTAVNERGGEIINLPSGAKIIPHDISLNMTRDFNAKVINRTISPAKLQKDTNVSVSVTVQGNVIGNREYAREMGENIAEEIIKKIDNIA